MASRSSSKLWLPNPLGNLALKAMEELLALRTIRVEAEGLNNLRLGIGEKGEEFGKIHRVFAVVIRDRR